MTFCTSCGDQHPGDVTACPRTGQSLLGGPCGTRLARYEVERLLGDGGMGSVYRARHVMLNQHVAVKLLHAEFARRGDMMERFLREARAAAAIGNPHIIRVHDCDVTPDGRPFLVMEMLDGEGLEVILRRERRLTPQRTVALAQQLLDGLGAAHAAGIIHRDMKPANVFVRKTPDPAVPEFVTILDFGISKMADPSGEQQHLTQTGAVIGTPVYMAPEQIMSSKDVDLRVDLYATGVMLYEMLSGRLPYEGANTAELIVKACTVPPTPLREAAPDLPGPLVDVVERALLREASARWQTAAEFADALRRAVSSAPSLPTAPQGSGANAQPQVWSQAASSQVGPFAPHGGFTHAPITAAPPHTAVAPVGVPAVATPSHWGALPSPPAAPNLAAAPQWAPPVAAAPPRSSTARTVMLIVGVIAGLATLCCVGSIALGWFAADNATSNNNGTHNPPQMQPVNPPQPQMQPVNPPQPQMQPVNPAQPQMQPVNPSQPQMVPMNESSGFAPLPPGVGVQADAPEVVGFMPVDAVQAVLDRAVATMDRCRVATPQRVRALAMVQPNGRVVIARPADDNPGDASVARCVANRFQAAGPVASEGNAGIVRFTVRLAAQ